MTELTPNDIEIMLKHKELDRAIIASAPVVVVILTQSWCSEWQAMQHWLPRLDTTNFYYFVYDKSDNFEQVCSFKEDIFKNDLIPYLRFYKNGALVYESNYMREVELKDRLATLV
jgi:hypothetical protein